MNQRLICDTCKCKPCECEALREAQALLEAKAALCDRLRALVERNLRLLAADPEADIPWDNIDNVFDTHVKGHDDRREHAEQAAEAATALCDKMEGVLHKTQNVLAKGARKTAEDMMSLYHEIDAVLTEAKRLSGK